MIRPLLFGVLALLAPAIPAQLANRPPAPEWLAAPGGERSISWQGKLLKGILLVAAEEPTRVIWNGETVATVGPAETATGLDITTRIVSGKNRLTLQSTGKVAALLELNGDLAAKMWVATDGTWQTKGNGKAVSLGSVDADPATNPFDLGKTFDAYNSWKLASRTAQRQATDPTTFTVPPGFEVELVRSAGEDEDSWVSMTFDPEGRVTLGMEKKGLLRLTLSGSGDQKVERIDETLEECRGLLYAHGALYANANDSKALYRLRDADGDGVFEERTELLRTGGGVGHGRNHLTLGPDGRVWIAHGNNVLLPESGVSPESPFKNDANDQLVPNPWDGSMFDGNVELPAGHILALDPETNAVSLMAGGLRNPLDLAFNRTGELFTFDADMERDVGAPWYMPTRVLHIVPGSDWGWRRGTGRWPASHEDTLPSVINIGLSSPTGICFGYGTDFPAKYEEALFISDWSYGRIIAVHLTPNGASYRGDQETFISGRPLNVTDVCVGPDGALWFTTGGRGTQSGLYRVVWKGPADPAPGTSTAPTPEMQTRRALESGKAEPSILQGALDSDDRFLRHAARLALERDSSALTPGQIRSESHGWRAITTWLATVRVGDPDARAAAMEMAASMPWDTAGADQKRASLRVLEIGFARGGDLKNRSALRVKLEKAFPTPGDPILNRELAKFLVFLRSDRVIDKAAGLLANTDTSEDLLYHPFMLRHLDDGWTQSNSPAMFTALNRAEKLNGASTYFKSIADTRAELAAKLAPELAASLADVIAPPKPAELSAHALPRHTFREWTMNDLEPLLSKVDRGRSFDGAKKALIAAQCVFCHRVSNDTSLPAGLFGPDLTQVSARFGRRDLLDHILNPSKIIDEKFRFLTVTLSDGSQKMGALESEDDERLILKPNPLSDEKVEIGRDMISRRDWSSVSPMPAGLLNGLKQDEILDLLAYFEALGDPKDPRFAK